MSKRSAYIIWPYWGITVFGAANIALGVADNVHPVIIGVAVLSFAFCSACTLRIILIIRDQEQRDAETDAIYQQMLELERKLDASRAADGSPSHTPPTQPPDPPHP